MKLCPHPRSLALLTAGFGTVLALSACGSSSGSHPGGTNSASAQDAKLTQSAQAQISKYLSVPAFTPPGPAVDAAKAKGKTILVVAHDLVSDELVGIANGVKQAGAAAGLQVSIYNGEGQPSTIQQGIQRGISERVGAILLDGVAANLVPTVLQAATAAHVPVVGMTIGLPSEGGGGPGVDAAAAADNNLMGELIADTAIVKGDGTVRAILEDFNNPDSVGVVAGIKKAFAQCPSCKIVATADVEPPDWPTQLATTTASLVQSNPTANFVLPTADTMGIFATAGIQQAGAASRVKVVSADGSGAGPLSLVQKGTVYIADPGASPSWTGWLGVDQALRLMTGMKPGNPVVPTRYLDSANLGSLNVSSDSALYGDGYEIGFRKLWGLS